MSPSTLTRQHRRDTFVAWSFVGVQAVLLLAIVTLPRNTTWVPGGGAMTIGSTLIAVGVAIGLWSAAFLGRGLTPSPLPNGSVDLVTRGPYTSVRHPMYSAVMILSIGISVRSGSLAVIVVTAALVALFSIKSRWEEMHLADSFPGYQRYGKTTGRFLPRRRIV